MNIEGLYFKDELHNQIRNEYVQKVVSPGKTIHRELEVFIYLLSATYKRTLLKYFTKDEIDFDGILEAINPYSTSEKRMIRLGLQLLGYGDNITIHEVLNNTDDKNTQVVMNALKMRYIL